MLTIRRNQQSRALDYIYMGVPDSSRADGFHIREKREKNVKERTEKIDVKAKKNTAINGDSRNENNREDLVKLIYTVN